MSSPIATPITAENFPYKVNPMALAELADLFDAMDVSADDAVQAVLTAGLASGSNPLIVASQLAGMLSPSRAETIARTEMLGAYRDAALANYQANSDVVGQWMWSASGGACIACAEEDGQVFGLDEPFVSHPSCRCSPIPVTLPWSDILGPLGIDASDIPDTSVLGDYVPLSATFEQMSFEEQAASLGSKSAAAAVRDGLLTPHDFVGHIEGGKYDGSIYVKSLREALTPQYNSERIAQIRQELAEAAKGFRELGATEAAQSEAEKALTAAQSKVADLVQSGAPYDDIRTAKWEAAQAQAAVDVEQGGRGAAIFIENPRSDPLNSATFEQTMDNLFGRQLTRDELGGLVGAPAGSFVDVFPSGNSVGILLRGPAWNPADPLNPDVQLEYSATRTISKDAEGNLFAHNVSNMVDPALQGQGLGATILADQVDTLSQLGVSYIETTAGGSAAANAFELASANFDPRQIANGYYTWPRLGYDAPLVQDARDAIGAAIARGEVPASWGSFDTLSELMTAPGGPEWWKANGISMQMHFDLADGSYSRQALQDYLERRGAVAASRVAVQGAQQELDVARAEAAARTAEQIQTGNTLTRTYNTLRHDPLNAELQQAHRDAEVAYDQAKQAARLAEQRVKAAEAQLDIAQGGTGIKIDYRTDNFSGASSQDSVQSVFGRDLSDREMVTLSGAQVGDAIEVWPTDRGFEVNIDGDHLERHFEVYKDGRGQVVLHDTLTVNKDARDVGSGKRLIEGMQEMDRLGIDRIVTQATRGPTMNGYETWAKLGFDGPIPRSVLRAARAEFGPDVKRVWDILRQPGGAAWWRANGDTFVGSFSFKRGSASYTQFERYLRILERRPAFGE